MSRGSRTGPRSVIIEADGGSRGNPGPAAYGALLRDADTGEVIAEEGTTIGIATNNVAEYSGLIAGLKLAEEFAPEADIEVRMDSKLVVEQMSGRWKIKHPDMRPLAAEAHRLAPFGTTYTWIPREQNSYADRLANEALDGKRHGVTALGSAMVDEPHAEGVEEVREPAQQPNQQQNQQNQKLAVQEPARGWGGQAVATTVLLIRHGATALTLEKRFSGGARGSNPGLTETGRAQVAATAEWLAPIAPGVDLVVTSPLRRCQESAQLLADRLGVPVVVEPRFAEVDFGAWEGLTYDEIEQRFPDQLRAWVGSSDVAPPEGESFREVEQRVAAGMAALLATAEHAGRTVVVVSHVSPIKTLVADALGAPLESVFRMELSPASVTEIAYFSPSSADSQGAARASLRLFNARPPGHDAFAPVGSVFPAR